ncbi:MAG UNVERIFIED_CONTAM: hypothetical protein LVR18_34045 [Planctomycetaceae bacterium]
MVTQNSRGTGSAQFHTSLAPPAANSPQSRGSKLARACPPSRLHPRRHSPSVAQLLKQVRLRIRRDSTTDGLLLLTCALAGIFWTTLLLDEAWFGLQKLELPVGLRAVMLGIVVPATLWLTARRICFPLLRKIRDLDVALLLERRFPLFQDRLVTTVEASIGLPADSPLAQQMLQRTIFRSCPTGQRRPATGHLHHHSAQTPVSRRRRPLLQHRSRRRYPARTRSPLDQRLHSLRPNTTSDPPSSKPS